MARILLILFILFLQWGCANDTVSPDSDIKDPESHIFYGEYDNVWRSIQLAVRKYPVHLNNIESGLLETDYIKNDKIFADPNESRNKIGLRYRIAIRAVKGKMGNRSVVKVICTKTPEVQRDFFTGYQPLASDGLEEDLILYRIGRYLEMDRILSRANSEKN
jgi:hypothetical protein